MSIGKKIRENRDKKGITQEKFAELVGAARQTVSSWENDKFPPDSQNLLKVAQILGVSVDYLLGDSTEHKTQTARDLDELVRELARQNPDLTLRFRDVVRNFDKYSPKTQKTIADGMFYVLGLVDNVDEFDNMRQESKHGKI